MQTSIFISDILLQIEFWINCTYVCTCVDDKNKETKVVTHTYVYLYSSYRGDTANQCLFPLSNLRSVVTADILYFVLNW